MTLLATGLVLLFAVVVAHLLLTFGLVRRIRLLQERLADRGPETDRPKVGGRVGEFVVSTVDGGRFTSADLDGRSLVGFFAAGCRPCHEVVDDFVADPPAERFVAFVDYGTDEPTLALVERLRPLGLVVMMDLEGTVAKAFGQAGFPTLVRVEDGVVAESGHRRTDLVPAPPRVLG